MTEDKLARSFETGGADYDRYRPSFPSSAAELVAPGPVQRAVDVGAGTGKFTSLLVGRAATVVAVDPSTSMLRELQKNLPAVDCRLGSAENLPIDDEKFDLVTVAQAFHWFDTEAACAEFRRVLVPAGRLALVWNTPDPTCNWDVEAYEIAHGTTSAIRKQAVNSDAVVHGQEDLPGFSFQSARIIPWTETISRRAYLSRWTTVSSYLAGTDSFRKTMLSSIERILDIHPATKGKSVLPLPHRTEILLYRAN